jgi:hypothetical protein
MSAHFKCFLTRKQIKLAAVLVVARAVFTGASLGLVRIARLVGNTGVVEEWIYIVVPKEVDR